MGFRKRYDGVRPLDGHLITGFSVDGCEYEVWDLCSKIKGMNQFKVIARQPMQHKANWLLVANEEGMRTSRDGTVMQNTTPDLYEATKAHIMGHLITNLSNNKKRYVVSIYHGSKEELKAKLLMLYNSI